MVTSDPSAMVNAGICAVIVLVLMFYQREGARHRPAISLLAYFVVLVYASVPFRYLFGLYQESHWMVVIVNLGLRETINRAAGAMQKDQNGGDIPNKKQFARTIGAVTSTSVTFGESGWFKIATVFMPQATSTAVIKLYGGAGFNVGAFEQAAISELVLRAGNGSPVG
ncbi:phage holin family protein, partial [Salmonella enterica]|nr:phage holin family protein [Salmonella enterica]